LALKTLQALRQGQVDLEDALRRVVDEVVAALGADRGTLYLLDHARQELVSRVAHLPELSEIRLRIGEGVAGSVAATGQAITMPEGAHDTRFTPRIDALTGYQTRSLVAVAVRDADGAILGVLQVLNRRVGRFDAVDVAQLTALGGELAVALAETSLGSQLRPDAPRPLDFRFNHIVGESVAMREVFRRTSRAARTDATVLVRGESGSGKEVIARAVHVNSPRRDSAFIKVDCAALPAQLIENELFGHERGAFTGADRSALGKVDAADGGTLFLDEIGELPLAVQGKLLRLLQDRCFVRVGGTQPVQTDLRFVCATNRDLEADVLAGRFRQDLYYRLRVVQIVVPPLRLRGPADLDRLIDHFFYALSRRHGRRGLTLSIAARTLMHHHPWPGNVRELENCIESAVVLAPGQVVDALSLALDSGSATPAPLGLAAPVDGRFSTDLRPLREVEQAYVGFVVDACDGNRSAAARLLGIGRNTLLRKLRADVS
jgi:Nif-specific regulatory protein